MAVIEESSWRSEPGGGIARVGEGRLAVLGALLVELGEVGDRQVDLAAHLDQLGRVLDPQRDRLDRAQVLGDVLADAAVAAGRSPGEDPVLVGEGDRQPVDLRLGDVADLTARDVEPLELSLDPLRPGAQLVLVAGVGEREHRLVVLDLLELVQRLPADPLRRRVRGEQLGVGLLDLPQLAQQVVVVGVGDRRVVEHVVAVIVLRRSLAARSSSAARFFAPLAGLTAGWGPRCLRRPHLGLGQHPREIPLLAAGPGSGGR